jgi:hypothetical protein
VTWLVADLENYPLPDRVSPQVELHDGKPTTDLEGALAKESFREVLYVDLSEVVTILVFLLERSED